MRETYFLCGNKIVLRPVEPDDYPEITKWFKDATVTYYMFYGQRPMNKLQIAEEIGKQVDSANNVVMIIEEKVSGNVIGFMGLYDVHLTARKAELRIMIGEKNLWGKGYGTEATELLTYYAFDRLNLNRVWLGVTSDSKRAFRTYERVGYQVEGMLRQDIYRNSRYYDSIRMSILREDYYPDIYESHKKRFGVVEPEKIFEQSTPTES